MGVVFVEEGVAGIRRKWRSGTGIEFEAFAEPWGIVTVEAPCFLVGQAYYSAQIVAVVDIQSPTLEQHCERRAEEQNKMLVRKTRDSLAWAHWRIAGVLYLVMGSTNPCLHLSREVHEEAVVGMGVDDVFAGVAAKRADYPF
jgi:hypothetical protein